MTQCCLKQIQEQRVPNLAVVVVDDGSTDGTGEMLKGFPGLTIDIVCGDGSLWWGGAVAAGLRHIDARAAEHDRVLMLNDDVVLPPRFFTDLEAAEAKVGQDAMLGCVQRDMDGLHPDYVGYEIDYQRQSIRLLRLGERSGQIVEVDGLAGRGLLFSVRLMRAIGYVDAKRFPHYWGDIEFTARARDFGYRVACITDLIISTSFAPSDSKVLSGGWRKRFFSPVSSHNVWQRLRFWMRRGPHRLRRTAVLRFAWLQSGRLLKRAIGAGASDAIGE